MKKRKVLLVLFALVLMASLALTGCAKGGTQNGGAASNNSGNNQGGAASPNNEAAGDSVVFPPADKVTLKMVAVPHGNIKKGYNDLSLFKQLEEKSNVQVDWNMIPSDGLVEKMNLIFATNDLPDAFFGPETTSAVTSDKTKQLIPLNDLIDKYAPNFKKILEEDKMLRSLITHEDGNIYYLPMIEDNPAQAVPNAMFINKKWLDELGLEVPTTTDELYNVLKALRKKTRITMAKRTKFQ